MRRDERLTFQQKFGLGVFIVIAGATFVFGIIRLHKNIILPFYRPESDFTIKTTDQLEQERREQLIATDTDGDGVNDYDELYVFRTSPYLDDTDSDGISDGIEVANQTDPNCPLGKSCLQSTRDSAGSTTSVRPTVSYQVPEGGGLVNVPDDAQPPAGTPGEEEILQIVTETFGDPTTLTTEGIAERLEAMSSDELRGFLLKIGIPQNVLDTTDDATIRELLQQTLNEMSAEGAITDQPVE